MTQRRFFNYGSTVTAQAFNEAMSNITSKGVLKGGGTYIVQPNTVMVEPVSLVFPSGIILQEPDTIAVTVPFSSINKEWTITYRHQDGGLVGGSGARLAAEPGFLQNSDAALQNGVVIAYVKYPGSGALQQTHIFEAPKATIDAEVTIGDGDYRLPPFGEGFLLTNQQPGSPVITPATTSNDTYATFQYREPTLTGGILLRALASGIAGNDLSFNLTSAASSSVVAITANRFQINFGPGATMQSIVTMLQGSVPFSSKFSVSVVGAGATACTAFPLGNTGTLYQNLAGGVTNTGIAYVITNNHTAAVTHTLKWVFVARKQVPESIVLEFSLGGTSSILLSCLDTNSRSVSLDTPTDLTQSSGLTRRVVRVTDGDFISGQRYIVQATVLTSAGESTSITFLGTSHCNLPF